MLVRYTPMYPDEVPNIAFVDVVNLSEDDIQELTQMIIVWKIMEADQQDKAPEFLGMAMIYNITEIVKDWLLDHNKPKVEVPIQYRIDLQEGSLYDQMMRKQQAEKEAADAQRLQVGRI